MQWLRSKSLFTNTHKRCFCEQHVRIVFVFLAKENTKRFTGCDMDLVNQRILSPNGHFLFFTKIRIFFFKDNYKTNSPTRSRRRKSPYYRTALSKLQNFLWRSPFLFLVNNENPLKQNPSLGRTQKTNLGNLWDFSSRGEEKFFWFFFLLLSKWVVFLVVLVLPKMGKEGSIDVTRFNLVINL